MRKMSVGIVLLAGVLTAICRWTQVDAMADDDPVTPSNQVFNDEGYGNSDEEYYNSEDDRVNDEGAPGDQETGNIVEGPSK